jgi:hypothetical protein
MTPARCAGAPMKSTCAGISRRQYSRASRTQRTTPQDVELRDVMETSEHQHDPNKTQPLRLRSQQRKRDSGAERPDNDKPFYKHFNFWMVTFTAVYSVVSIGLFCQTKKSADAARRGANAAAVQAETGRRALELTETADVELEAEECSTKAFALDTRLTLHYRNFGRTRADNFRQAFSPGILPSDNPPAPNVDMTRATTLSANEPLPSGTTPTVRELLNVAIAYHVIPDPTPEAAFDRLRSGDLRFGFWGRLQFVDVLRTFHESYFSYEWDRVWLDQCIFTQITQTTQSHKTPSAGLSNPK